MKKRLKQQGSSKVLQILLIIRCYCYYNYIIKDNGYKKLEKPVHIILSYFLLVQKETLW